MGNINKNMSEIHITVTVNKSSFDIVIIITRLMFEKTSSMDLTLYVYRILLDVAFQERNIGNNKKNISPRLTVTLASFYIKINS